MASKFLRRQKWWVKLRQPLTGEFIRESLEHGDPARAELLRQRLDLEVALLDRRFQAAKMPEWILGVPCFVPGEVGQCFFGVPQIHADILLAT